MWGGGQALINYQAGSPTDPGHWFCGDRARGLASAACSSTGRPAPEGGVPGDREPCCSLAGQPGPPPAGERGAVRIATEQSGPQNEGSGLTGALQGPETPAPAAACGPLSAPLTTQRSRRLVSLAVRTVMLVGATSGGACSVWMTLEDWLKGLGPTTFTCLMRNLGRGQQDRAPWSAGNGGGRAETPRRLLRFRCVHLHHRGRRLGHPLPPESPRTCRLHRRPLSLKGVQERRLTRKPTLSNPESKRN